MAKKSPKNENLLNEYKGNIFEYVVASNIARICGIEKQFLNSVPKNFQSQLEFYEKQLKHKAPGLAVSLPKFAQDLTKELLKTIDGKIVKVVLMGKLSSSSKTDWKECDILLVNDKNVENPISIKLCKENAFINTKSGGIKSFYTKYFTNFDVKVLQKDLNYVLQTSYERMSFKLHDIAGIQYEEDFSNWINEGMSVLPGELPEKFRRVIWRFYYEIAENLNNALKIFMKTDKKLFKENLEPICGISLENTTQAICYHTHDLQHDKYTLNKIKIIKSEFIKESLEQVEVSDIKIGLSSFIIKTRYFDIQIRVKPMNKFTTPALKVNCSVRY